MKIKRLNQISRDKLFTFAQRKEGLIGIELGVAKGAFSKQMVETKKFSIFFGIDKYSDHHNIKEYKFALKSVGLLENYKLFKITFDDALDIFEDQYFDFVYIDGYAHNGQKGGETICKWIRKVKPGGVLCGDDYDKKFPLTVESVNYVSKETGLELYITDPKYENDHKFSSWMLKIDKLYNLKPNTNLKVKSKIADFYFKNKIKIKKIFYKIFKNE